MAESRFGNKDLWPQPLPDARPSTVINAPLQYSKANAQEDAESLYKAMKGMGTDENTVIGIAGKRTYRQRQMIRSAFPSVCGGKDLIKYIKDDFRGKMEDFLVALFQTQGEFDTSQIVKACKGMGTNEDLLMEILCTRNWEQLENIKKAWTEKKPLAEYVDSEVKGNFENLLLGIINRPRDPNGPFNEHQCKLDAEEIHRLIYEKSKNAKETCVALFTQRSWRHIARINEIFQGISKEHTLETALKEKMDGDTARAMRVIIEFASQPYDFWAKKILKTMKGAGTKDADFCRIVCSRCDVDLDNVRIIFAQRYGEGKTLKAWIKGDFSGDFEKLALNVCGF